jgi:hypothetical protein
MPNTRKTSPSSDIPRPRWGTLVLAAVVLAAAAACGKDDTPTSPTTTTTTTTVASASITEDFSGVLPVGGSRFYSFTVGENGTVNITLTSIGGAGVPSTVWVGLGIGTPNAEDCSTTSSVNTQAGSSAQVTGTYQPGIYCAKVSDIGNLAAPATFAITVAHP